jgi:hypothetical protein
MMAAVKTPQRKVYELGELSKDLIRNETGTATVVPLGADSRRFTGKLNTNEKKMRIYCTLL